MFCSALPTFVMFGVLVLVKQAMQCLATMIVISITLDWQLKLARDIDAAHFLAIMECRSNT